jgi:Tol biopolymer transport system component
VSARPGPADFEIYVSSVDGGPARNLTGYGDVDDSPVVSPNGRKIAFVRGIPPSIDIWVMNADGSGQTQRTGAQAEETDPAWGPDSRAFAFTYREPGSRTFSIRVLDWTGGDVRRPGSKARFAPHGRALAFRDQFGIATLSRTGARYRRLVRGGDPVWSPAGRRIAFERSGFVMVMNADGTRVRRLARGADPVWSKRGLIAFVRAGDIFVVRPDGRGQRRLTRGEAVDSVPAWSPDGSKLAFVRQPGQDPRHVYVVSANGSGLAAISQQSGGVSASRPAWSPDGRSLYYAARLRILPL